MVNLCVHFGNFLRGQKTLFGWVGVVEKMKRCRNVSFLLFLTHEKKNEDLPSLL